MWSPEPLTPDQSPKQDLDIESCRAAKPSRPHSHQRRI
jgi:hypothetical protein